MKTPVFPFVRFPGVDTILGPEDEIDRRGDGGRGDVRRRLCEGPAVGWATATGNRNRVHQRQQRRQAQCAADREEPREASNSGILAREGTAAYLRAHGIPVEVVFKVNEGRPNVADHILNNQIQLIVNTPLGRESFFDDRVVRRVAMLSQHPVHHHADRCVSRPWKRFARCGARRSTFEPCRTTTQRSHRGVRRVRWGRQTLARQVRGSMLLPGILTNRFLIARAQAARRVSTMSDAIGRRQFLQTVAVIAAASRASGQPAAGASGARPCWIFIFIPARQWRETSCIWTGPA